MDSVFSATGLFVQLKENELGLISPGYKADLLVIDGDPTKDVTVLGKRELIKYVIQDGKEIDLTPAQKRIKDPAGWRISSYSGKILKK